MLYEYSTELPVRLLSITLYFHLVKVVRFKKLPATSVFEKMVIWFLKMY